MKILWLCNGAIPAAAAAFGLKPDAQSWLVNISDRLMENREVQFDYLFVTGGISQGWKAARKGERTFFGVNEQTQEGWEKAFGEILAQSRPDVVHIWGSEYPYTCAMTRAAQKAGLGDRVVISIQGMVSSYEKHYFGGIPGAVQVFPTFRDILRRDTLASQHRDMKARGEYEKQAIRNVRHVIGRTFWDHACTKQINPEAEYHFNNETLRPVFYQKRWSRENCRPHSIFVSQGHYPIKGLHYLLDAAGTLKEKYPDLKIRVGGSGNAFKTGLLRTAYGKYIQETIREKGLEQVVEYVGMLGEQEMAARFLEAEVFVAPAAIENSCNSVGEAMLLGMPVVASNVGGTSDLLAHGTEGFLYQADAPYLLSYYIDRFFSDPALEQRLGQAARLHAQKTHDPEVNYARLLEIYREIAQG